ncbi:hypothetical protein MVEN_00968700 [Mycena venus]|uniref:F-box domain-containing protein n=1 Tax=Mycena venus TaxID=2733690 RepID=A0A8H6YAV4_9AGAR|nr:hypothetical protein MVEN_00968700 [Mycena venus]
MLKKGLKAGVKALLSRGARMVHPNRSRRVKSLKIDHLIWRTNAPLSGAEVVQVTGLLAQAQASLRVADPDHAQIVSAQIQSYRIALAPHKKLPPEVLAIIFVNCVGTPIILPPSTHEPALALAGTCRTWRHILLNIPNLWNNIFLDFRGSKPVKLLEFAKLWISRSENTLITIRNSTSRWTENRLIEENVDPITYLVAPYVTRCREIDLRFLESSIDEFFTLPAGSIERLEVLYLETLGFTMPFSHASNEPLDVFRSAPRLRRASPGDSSPACTSLPLTYPPLAMLAILRESHSLLECSFSIIQLDDALAAELDRLPECVLPALQSLMVEFSPQTVDYAPFLRPLVLPALTDLELRPLEAGFLPQCPWSQRAYAGLLARSRFTLRRLAILHYTISPADLESILSGMPSLTDFHLYLWDSETTEWDRGILRGLGTGALLPALEVLTFSTYPLADVLDALEARVRLAAPGAGGRVARMKALNMSMTWRHDIPQEAMTRFMRLAEGGGPRCMAFTHTRAYAHDRTTTQICAS